MSDDRKAEQASAMIAALQTILDKLPDKSAPMEHGGSQIEDEHAEVKNPTHQLFVGRLDQHALAGLFTSIRIIHSIHNVGE